MSMSIHSLTPTHITLTLRIFRSFIKYMVLPAELTLHSTLNYVFEKMKIEDTKIK